MPPYETLVALYLEFNLCQEEVDKQGNMILVNYWQGKKDGLRLALSVLAPDTKTARRWAALQLSSTGSHYVSEKEEQLLEQKAGWYD